MAQPHPASLAIASFATCVLLISGACEKEQPAPGTVVQPRAATDEHGHDHDHDHGTADEHAHDEGDDHDHGESIALGEQSAGVFTLKASRDGGDIVPGKDSPIDVVITSTDGAAPSISAVRFWIGAQDARGSVKALAEIEDQKEPDRWHTHTQIPQPLPEGSTLWVEVEVAGGEKLLASFKLVP